MTERENYMLCCDCGLAVKQSSMFIKKYQNTAICLCRKCAVKLCTEIADYGIAKGVEKLKKVSKMKKFEEMTDQELIDFCHINMLGVDVCNALQCDEFCKEEDCPMVQLLNRFENYIKGSDQNAR